MSCLSLSRLRTPGSLSQMPSSLSSSDSKYTLDPQLEWAYCPCIIINKYTEDLYNCKCRSHFDKHAHLTNCIHLKNRSNLHKDKMVMEAPDAGELPLMRELTTLSRNKSLRDPATRSTWKSPQREIRQFQRKEAKKKDELRREKHGDGKDENTEEPKLKDQGGAYKNGVVKRENLRGKQRAGGEVEEGFRREKLKEAKMSMGKAPNGSSRWDGSIVDFIGSGFNDKGRQAESLAADNQPRNRNRMRKSVGERGSEEESTGREFIGSNWNVQALKATHGSKVHPDTLDFKDKSSKRYENQTNADTFRQQIHQKGGGEILKNGESGHVHEEIGPNPRLSLVESVDGLKILEQGSSLLGSREQKSDMESASDSDEVELTSLEHQMAVLSMGLRSRSQSPLLARNTMRRKNRRTRSGSKRLQTGNVSKAFVKQRQSFDGKHAALSGDSIGRYSSSVEVEMPVCTADEEESEPKNGCGIPWYWSCLQKQRSKSFFEVSGRRLSNGYPELSRGEESRVYKAQGSLGREVVVPTFHVDTSVSSLDSDPEALPLILGPDLSAASPVNINSILSPNEYLGTRSRGRSSPAADLVGGGCRQRVVRIGFPSSRTEGLDDGRQRSISQKYRPKSFKDVVGQTLVVQALSNAVLKERVASFYLFQGPQGTGKTSAARIFSAALICLSSAELRPCGLCRECVIFNLGNHMDVVEVDSTRHSGVDSMKPLLDYMLLPPSSAKFKVSIIDECQSLTAEAWNMLFKNLEEPPAHVVFIFITNDQRYLHPGTSRCQKFLFSKIKSCDIVARLQQLALKENVDVEREAFELIASRVDGSLRHAETTLDQLSLLGNRVTLSHVQELAGLVPEDKLLELLDSAMSGQTVNTVKMIRGLLVSGIDVLSLISQLATLITDFLAGSYNCAKMKRKEGFFGTKKLTEKELASLRHALKILSESVKQIRSSSDQTTWLTASLLQFAPDPSVVHSSSRTCAASSIDGDRDTTDEETQERKNAGSEKALNNHENVVPRSVDDPEICLTSKGRRKRMESIPNVTKFPAIAKPSENRTKLHSLSMTERIIQSSDHSSQYDHACESTSKFVPNRRSADSMLPHETLQIVSLDSSKLAGRKALTPMHQQKIGDVWRRVLQGSRSKVVKQLLKSQGKLISLSITEAYAIAYVEFRNPQQKLRAERSLSSISRAFQAVLGCPVEVRITLASMPAETERIEIGDAISFEQEDEFPYDQEEMMKASSSEIVSAASKTADSNHSLQSSSNHLWTRVEQTNREADKVQHEIHEIQEEGSEGLTSAVGDISKARISPNEERLENAWMQEIKSTPGIQKLDRLNSQKNQNHKGKGELQNGSGRVSLGSVMQVEGNVERYSQGLQREHKAESWTRKSSRHLRPESMSTSLHNNSGRISHLDHENLRLESRTKSGSILCWKTPKTERKLKQPRHRRRRKGFLLKLVPCSRGTTL